MKSRTCASILLALAALGVGCGGGTDKAGESPNFGTVALSVQVALGNGLTLTSVDYTISGPSQYTGNLVAPANSRTISSRIGSIAPGNYSVTLTGHTNENASITCSGSAANVAVQAGKAAGANVSMVCQGPSSAADAGMVDIAATASLAPTCPIFLNDTASALEIPADGTTSITLTGTASLSSPAAMLTWSAPSGTIAPGTSSAVTYTCAQSPNTIVVPVTLSISNGASGCTPATDVINITCSGVTPTSCIVHVTTSGVDTNDGSNWAQALANVQPALDVAVSKVSAGTCSSVEVWVAAGTYKPTYQTDSSDARTATFQLKANVALYGGFSGTESTLNARSVANNVTTLSGDIGITYDNGDNSYHVVTGVTGATIDGFTITGGNANGWDADHDAGGGMYNNGASPSVANCTFSGNSAPAGSGMFNSTSSPTVTNCTFSGNGGAFVFGGGGGMYNYSASPTVTNCIFSNNTHVAGGGMYNYASSSPTVTNCVFSGNIGTSYSGGGGMYNESSSPAVTNCTFLGNNGGSFGGGMANWGSSLTVTHCTFSGNSATESGGAMFNIECSPTVTNCTFSGNNAPRGGGMSNEYFASPTVSDCTFTGNSAEEGGGICNRIDSLPTVNNCIFWNDTAEFNDTSALVTYSIVQGGYASGTNIITQDPLFVDASSGNLHLQSSSPAIDQGADCSSVVPGTDKDGNARWDIASVTNAPGMTGVDIGAYEFQGQSSNGDAVIASCK